jgi:hypothetical protein
MTDKRSRRGRWTALGSLIEGIRKRLSPTEPLRLLGVVYLPQELIALFQEERDGITAAEHAEAVARGARKRSRELIQRNHKLRMALEGHVRATFGDDIPLLGDFGYERDKKGHKSVHTKVEAAEKAKATREARKTMGRVQKKKIKGSS